MFSSTKIDLGTGRGFVIDLGETKFDPIIPPQEPKPDNNMSLIGGIGDFASDISKTVHDTKKDYDTLVESSKKMKEDLTPGFNKLKRIVKRIWSSFRKEK